MVPMIGFHSVMERPESVRRVAPPTKIMATIRRAIAPSHILSARLCVDSRAEAMPLAASELDVGVEDMRSDSGRVAGTQWRAWAILPQHPRTRMDVAKRTLDG